ncbi:MAG: hypothetical protein R2797_12830 [Gelidibacter sp.]
MKKFNLLAALILLFISCQKEDDTLIPQNEAPQNLSVQILDETNVLLRWDDMQAPSYKIEYGLSGFHLGEGVSITTSTPSIRLNNLLPETAYDFYVQSVFSANNTSRFSSIRRYTTLAAPVVTEFRENLSEMRIFRGNLSNLSPSPYAFEYDLNTRLFTDYAHKQRLVALPLGTAMTNVGDGLPDFPEHTVIAKTFYYNLDEREPSLGKKIIETRVLIKTNGVWQTGDYIWNESQTEATLDAVGGTVPITWIDSDGDTNNVNYKIPSNTDCFTCHQTNDALTPIGPKLRNLNFEINGINQLQQLTDRQLLSGLSNPNDIAVLPNWEDTSASLEERARAYFDIQCAHCHSAGGFCEMQSVLRLSFETSLSDSKIVQRKNSISSRINTYNPGFSMPYIGTTMIHTEGVALIQAYLDTL